MSWELSNKTVKIRLTEKEDENILIAKYSISRSGAVFEWVNILVQMELEE